MLVAVVLFSVVGSYALYNSMFDVYVMFAFGLIGFYMESQRVPLAPMILGLILGPMVEENLRAGLIKTGGDLTPFFTRPICATLIALLVISYLATPIGKLFQSILQRFGERGP